MLGLVRPSSGSVRVLGEDPAGGAAARGAARARLSAGERRAASVDDRRGDAGLLRAAEAPAGRRQLRAARARRHRGGRAPPRRRLFERHAPAPRPGAGAVRQPARTVAGRADLGPRSGAATELLRNRPRLAPRRRDGAAVVARARRIGRAGRSRRGDEPGPQGRRRQHRRAARARGASGRAFGCACRARRVRWRTRPTLGAGGRPSSDGRAGIVLRRKARSPSAAARPAEFGARTSRSSARRSTNSTPLSRRGRA